MTLHIIEVVEVDTDPLDSFYDREGTVRAEYANLPERFLTALLDVTDKPEEAECDECGKGVGYYLEETDDGRLEHAYWHWTTLIAVPDGPVTLLCEDCTPVIPEAAPSLVRPEPGV